MKAITDIGQAVILAGGKEIFLNPSFLAMSRIGSPEQIVDAFVKVHGGHYPKHLISDAQIMKVVNARCFAEMAASAASVVRNCSEGNIAEVIGSYSVNAAGRLLFKPGAIPIEDVIQLARHLMLHGVMGDQPPGEFEGKKEEYSDKFDVRTFVYTAVAHLGMGESDAWNMTMTSFRAAMNAKFPQKEKTKVPTQEKYDEVMDWAEQMLAIDAQRSGPH
ncbi:TPA: hypothetical protein MYO58_001713 [Citrobacter freundii]|uniref:DUF6246 family protein n=1 Tax=Citrobacter freundii TaxID=546 RepID=UPI001BCD831E|nr:DUF6246 family protein [Citrobacter freundii]EJG2168484.1 hypothetical protein [Citrobacter freundii 47N]EKY0022214.1 hypothetical protein [Citrobacter freundii]ELR9559735.1 hypothetical protein [Citrobacter freundii]HCB1487770.1 hypothetical protein [Citrobacter freundii]HCB1944989.1 hypothetical protein [Citrobacter freundii]